MAALISVNSSTVEFNKVNVRGFNMWKFHLIPSNSEQTSVAQWMQIMRCSAFNVIGFSNNTFLTSNPHLFVGHLHFCWCVIYSIVVDEPHTTVIGPSTLWSASSAKNT